MSDITHLDSEANCFNFILNPADIHRLASLCGQCDQNLRLIETALDVELHNRGNVFRVVGDKDQQLKTKEVIQSLYQQTLHNPNICEEDIHHVLQTTRQPKSERFTLAHVRNRQGKLNAYNKHQALYLETILKHSLTFGIGPAGTGKTYLAVACAIEALETQQVSRLILVRPAVEAGENLGFLPGDLTQKIDPYCRPLYDALYEMLGVDRVTKLLERKVIEVAPLAYMRGRTLSDAFIILDESQNTTQEQMKMFLTRMGNNCKVVVTGDLTQIDLPRGQTSGLLHCLPLLTPIEAIGCVHFENKDVVRHTLVQEILNAYDKAEKK